MKQTSPVIRHEDLFFAVCLLLTSSLFYSRFLTSLSIALLVVLTFVRIDISPWKIQRNQDIDHLVRTALKNRTLMALGLLFFIPFVSGLWTDDLGDWLRIARIRLPFLLLPLAFVDLPHWRPRTMQYIAATAMVTALLTIPFVLYHFLIDYLDVLDSLEHGKQLWTPAYHIRYSLLLAYTALLGFYYYAVHPDEKWRRFFVIGASITALFMHFLAVRSGLFVLYAIGGGYLLYEMVTGKHKLKMAVGMALLILLPIIGVLTLPSLNKKWKYMRWDVERILRGEENSGSDNLRLLSFKGGIEVFQSSPFFGVGAGDLKQKMKDYFIDQNKSLQLYPHNQYIFTLASTGLVGFALFLFALFSPLRYNQVYRYPPALMLHLIIWLSFLVENTLETSLGVAIYLFFVLVTQREWQAINAANNAAVPHRQ